VIALGLLLGLVLTPRAVAAVGGPDAYGYVFSDSVSGGVTYGFEDIAATGTTAAPVSDTDDDVQNVPMGFSFTYYGTAYTTCDLCANGFIGFNNFGGALAGAASYNILPTPTASLPNSMIAGFWADLHPGQAGTVYYRTLGTAPNRRFIVQFQGVADRGVPTNLNTFQYKLFETSNKIEVHYQTLTINAGRPATIGIEDGTGTVGIQYSVGGLPATGRPFAIRFSPTRVINTNDSGFGSLRQALADLPAGGGVVFDPALSGQTVTVTSGELAVSNSPWNVARWTGDADSGISNTLTYTHAYNFGTATSAAINGVTLTGVAGGSPSAANFTLAGAASVLNGDPNNLPAGTGSRTLATDFVYGGNPATLTLTGLTAGQSYRTSIFSVGFDAPGARRITLAGTGVSQVLDQGAYGDNNGIRADYEFVATGANHVITLTPVVAASTCHIYGFVNAAIPGGFANRLKIDASALPAGLTISGNNASRVFNIAAGSAATLDSLTITGGGGTGGAGVASWGTLALNRVTLAGNHAPGGNWGGGLYSNGTLAMTHCTVANNSAEYGGGVFSDGGAGSTVFTHVTIVNNLARTGGGGMWLNGSNATLNNSIVALSSPNNAVPAGATVLTQTGINFLAGDPQLLPLANYGGLTPTMPPRVGSPVIDPAGGATTSTLTTDQRGFPRVTDGNAVAGAIVDIGAAEAGPIVTVTAAADAGAGSLRAAVLAATAADTRIRFAAALAGSTITLTSGEMNVAANRSLIIDGSSLTSGLILSGNNASRLFTVTSGGALTLDSLTLTGGNSTGVLINGIPGGGALQNQGALNLLRTTVSGNGAGTGSGGGIINHYGGTVSVTNCSFANNSASLGGGIYSLGTVALAHATLTNNTATGTSSTGAGGGLRGIDGIVTINNSIIAQNTATADVAPDIAKGASCKLTPSGANLVGNNTSVTTEFPAGALVGTTASLKNPLLAPLGNYGGLTQTRPPLATSPALHAAGAVLGSPVTDQRGSVRPLGAASDLGAVESNFDLVVTTAANSGAGSLREALAIAIPGTTITFAAGLSGQTITLGGSELVIDRNLTINASSLAAGVTISGNNASRVFNITAGGVVTMDSLTITAGNAANGGAVFNQGTLNLANATLSGNTASSTGGAIFNQSGGTLALVNCSLAGNVSALEGGAILNNSSGFSLTHCTLSGNTANGYSLGGGSAGGGIFSYGAVTLGHTISFGNNAATGADLMVFGGNTLTRVGANLVGSLSAGTTGGSGTISSANPQLAPLGNYGGPTRTLPPLPGSPALDAATGSAATADQRGFPRPLGAANDIGAVEAAILGTSPVLNSTIVSPLTTLTWTGASGATFELFFGTTAGSLASQGVKTSPFTPAAPLVPGTTYFWRVDTTLAGKTYRGVEMGFTVRSSIVVTTAADETNGMTVGGVSLREAIADAAASGTPETISFAPALSGQTITLANGRLLVGKSLQINASALPLGITIDANGAVTNHQVLEIEAGKTVTMDSLTITGGRGPGAGIRNRGILILNRSAVIGNHAPGNYGGGIFNEGGTLTVTNSTVANNSGYVGGGIFSDGTATFTHTTIAANAADFGGGLWRASSTTTITNTIIAGNVAPTNTDTGGTITQTGVNLIGGNARLTPLGYYGGPTPTMHPLADSPAIEPTGGAATSALTTDQRGFTRVVGGKVDLGAVEAGPAITVQNTNDTGAGSLRQALIDATVSGQRILFAPALNGGMIRLVQSELAIPAARRLFVDASGLAAGVTLSGEDARRLFYVQPNAVAALHGLTVRGGRGPWGGALANEGTLTLSHVAVVASTSTGVGGGIWSIGTLTLTNCTVANNTSATEGGGISAALAANTLTVRNSTVAGNQSGAPGGGIDMANGALHLTNSLIAGNTGGASPDIDGSVRSRLGVNFIGNPAGATGLGTAGTDFLTGNPQLGPLGGYGGPTPTLPLLPGSPAIDTAAAVAGTPATDQRGRPRVADGDGNNSAIPDIGAFEVGTTLVTTVADSGAGSLRGAIEGPDTGHEWILFDPAVFNGTPAATIILASQLSVANRSLHLDASRISGGVTVSGNGSARVMLIDPASKVEIDRMTITNGYAVPDQRGGGIFNQGTLSIRNSTISNNHAGQYGGGIDNAGTLAVINCTVANNSAVSDAGGIDNYGGVAFTLINSTLSGNASGGAGGGIWSDTPLTLSNALVAGNRAIAHNDISGPVTTDLGGNLVGDGTGLAGLTDGQNGNQVGTGSEPLDARLAPLGNYGGHTATMALLVGSPALNAGFSTGTIPALDQRGFPRVGQADIGAQEAGPVILVTNANDGGAGSLRQALTDATAPGTRILFNLPSTNSVITLTSGELAVSADRTIFLDASSLVTAAGGVATEPDPLRAGATIVPAGIAVSGNNASRVFSIPATGTVAMQRVTVRNGSNSGILNQGKLTLAAATLRDNSGTNGGGIQNAGGTLILNASTLSGNSAGGAAGGVLMNGGSLLMENTTLANNTAGTGTGGGIRFEAGAVGTIRHSTIAGNKSGTSSGSGLGAGIDQAVTAAVTLENSLIADNLAGARSGGTNARSDTAGNFKAIGANLIEVHSSGTFTGPAALTADPGLGALADNGGPTRTMMLLGGSPALDQGVVTGPIPFSDQRGFPRLLAAAPDLGAFESGAGEFTPAGLALYAKVPTAVGEAGDFRFEISSDRDFFPTVSTLAGTGVTNPGLFTQIYFGGNPQTKAAALGFIAANNPAGTTVIPNINWSNPGSAPANGYPDNLAAADNGGANSTNLFAQAVPGQFAGNQENYGVQMTGQLHIPSDAARGGSERIRFHDGVDDYAYLEIDGVVLIDDNDWTPQSGVAGAQATLDVSDSKFNDGEWVSFRMVMWEAGGGDNCALAWDALDRTGTDTVTGGTDATLASYNPANLPDGTKVNFTIHTSDWIPAANFRHARPEPAMAEGAATAAKFSHPSDVAEDSVGNLFIADSGNNRIRMCNPQGVISTVAGTGSFGLTDGDGEVAEFAFPSGIAVGPDDNVYVSDTLNHVIRKLTRPEAPGQPWTVTTVAGAGVAGFVNATGTLARFNHPHGLCVAADGTLYVADTANQRIRSITPLGVVGTHAGTGAVGTTNGNRLVARFSSPFGVAVNRVDGSLYVADFGNHRIRRIGTDNLVTTLAGSSAGFLDNDDGSLAKLRNPTGVAVDAGGSLRVADQGNHAIRKLAKPIDPNDPWKVTTVAGTGVAGLSDGRANNTGAQFNLPTGLCVTARNEVIVADQLNHRLRRITDPLSLVATTAGQDRYGLNFKLVIDAATAGLVPDVNYFFRWVAADGSSQALGQSFTLVAVPTVVTTPATLVTRTTARLNGTVDPNGSPTTVTFEYSTDPQLRGPLTVATFKNSLPSPKGVAVDASGNVYLATGPANKIVKITPAGVQTDFAGAATAGFANGTGTAARFDHPSDIAIDSAGNLYVADELNQRIRKITTPGAVVTTVAGSGIAGFADAAVATNGQFLFPSGVAVNAAGTSIHVADRGNQRIRVIADGALTTLAGDGTAGFADGAATSAQFHNPTSVAVDAVGNVYVADRDNHLIRVVNTTPEVLTIAGSGGAGFVDGTGTAAEFDFPTGLALDGDGNLYVADRGNHCLRQINAAGVVTTLAGSGLAGFLDSPASGQLWPATAAQFSSPYRVAVEAATGALYLTEEGSQRVRKVARGSLLSITLPQAYSSNGDLELGTPVTETLRPGSTYYFRARATNTQGPAVGEILSFATLVGPELAVLDGPNTSSAALQHAQPVPVDFGVTPRGTPVTRQFTIANPGDWDLAVTAINVPAGFSRGSSLGVLAPGASRTFTVTLTATADGSFAGNLVIVSDDPAHASFTIPLTGVVLAPPSVTTVAASAVVATGATLNATINPQNSGTTAWFEYATDPEFDGVLVSTVAAAGNGLNQPNGLVADADGNLYVADTLNHRIRKIAQDGTPSTFAGTGVAGFADGDVAVAQFNEPIGLALAADGTLYVADSKNHRIRAISASGLVTTHAGLGTSGFTDGVDTGARFATPHGLALGSDGTLYVADRGNHRIRKVAPDGTVSTLAGTGTAGAANGAGAVAQFNGPVGIAIDSTGAVYVTEAASHAIRKVTSGGATSVFAGAAAAAGFLEGNGTAARFSSPVGLAVDASNNLLVADRGNLRIRKVTPAGVVSTVAGTAVAGLLDGPGETARFDGPAALATTETGDLFVGELTNSTLRRIAPTRVVVQAASGLTGFADLPVTVGLSGLAPNTTYYFRAFATNGGGTTYGAVLSFGGQAGGSPFEQWQSDQFGEQVANQAVSGALANPVNDGVSNLLKYAFGLDPHVPAVTGLPTPGFGGGQLTLTYTKVLAATDLVYTPEWSTDLKVWIPAGITEEILSDNGTIQRIRAAVPVGVTKAKFLRLNVTLQQP
jgi:sugar lactone lactonase YvrE